jgi:FMN-dependent oxidoreductase (nitrilotriacetate monooxygenase family)
MTKQIHLTLVEQGGPAADSGLWNHPDFRPGLNEDVRYWEDLARTLESGGFDAIFFADTPALRADTPEARDHHLRSGGVPRLDPAYLIPLMAAVTEHLGFTVTSSISYDHPYPLARKFTTLDHLTDGRIGWNVVASNVRSAAINHGLDDQLPHDARYDRGDAFLEVAYALWNGSWEDGAVVRDPARGIYVDPDRVHEVDHAGEWFTLRAPHLSEPSPQRTPVLFQAGSSDRGRRFAATHAECVYLNANSIEETGYLVADVRRRADALGRDGSRLRFLPRIIPVLGGTEEEARRRYEDYVDHHDEQSAVVILQQWAGIDVRGRDPEEPLDLSTLVVEGSSSQHTGDYLKRRQAAEGRRFTVRDLLRMYAFGGEGNVTVGTPEQVADVLDRYVEDAGVDGFNIAYMVREQSVREFAEQVVPELRRRGRVPSEPRRGTLREQLLGAGPHLPDDHPGARPRLVRRPEAA